MAAARIVVTIWTLPIELASRSAACRAARRPESGQRRERDHNPPLHLKPDRPMTLPARSCSAAYAQGYPAVT
ncbi:hypothetical protein E0H26_22500 [Micromonospora zingiberis]|uniref:Uncharacterized protein n=1 Tax=Micromonospora zingiberis TaxID=2053011 RepID=A0A4R0G9C2_9ACTN|nr:hypothetical protein E0H26_22500 [Micromonospora zingiberis]